MSGLRDAKLRAWLAVAVLLVVAAGLGSRSSTLPLPAFVRSYAGDTLWAVLVFLLLAFATPRRPVLALAATALAIAFGVELLQLYRAPWLDALRATLPGRLLLGQGFLFSDLLCYTYGIGAAALVFQAVVERHLRTLKVIASAVIGTTVVVAVAASDAGRGSELFALIERVPGKDKTGHFLLMGALSMSVVLALVPRMNPPAGRACALVIAGLCVVTGLEEGSQYFISTRTFSVADLLCSWGGVVVFGAFGYMIVRRVDKAGGRGA